MKLIHKRTNYEYNKFEPGLNLGYSLTYEYPVTSRDTKPTLRRFYEAVLVIPFWVRLFPSVEYYETGTGYGLYGGNKHVIECVKGRQVYCLRLGISEGFHWKSKVHCEIIRYPFGKQEKVMARNEVFDF